MVELDAGAARAWSEISTDDETGAPIVKIGGELDLSNVESLGREIMPVLEGGPDLLILDLSALQFIDSSGIALLLEIAPKVGKLRLRRPSIIVRRVVELTGLSGILGIEP